MTICAPQTNFVMDPALKIVSGAAADGKKECTAKYDYTVGLNDQWVVTGYNDRKQRWCRWCDAALATDKVQVLIIDYVPATTKDRKTTGFTVLSSDTDGLVYMATDTMSTKTRQNWVEQADNACGKA
jgi:hypothetical protein